MTLPRHLARLAPLLALGACDDKGDTGGGGVPNLTVAGVVCTYESAGTECTVTVENTGDGGSGGFEVGLYASGGEPTPGDPPDVGDQLGGLVAGEVRGLTLTLSGTPGQVWAVVDVYDDVAEEFEDDNAVSTNPQRR